MRSSSIFYTLSRIPCYSQGINANILRYSIGILGTKGARKSSRSSLHVFRTTGHNAYAERIKTSSARNASHPASRSPLRCCGSARCHPQTGFGRAQNDGHFARRHVRARTRAGRNGTRKSTQTGEAPRQPKGRGSGMRVDENHCTGSVESVDKSDQRPQQSVRINHYGLTV